MAQLVKNLPLCGMPGLDPWVGKIPWIKERLLTPVFWPGEFHGLYSPWGHKQSDMTEQLSFQLFRTCNLLPFPNSKYFSQSYSRALKCDSVKW